MTKFNNLSIWILTGCILFIVVFRFTHVNRHELSWDVLGYYLPIPATIIHKDPTLKNIQWLKEANKDNCLTATYYQMSQNEKGENMYFFLFGMAFLYLPFFLLGHVSASLLDYPMDGFSWPYQYALVLGGVLYTIIGLVYLRKILKHYFSDQLTALLLLIFLFGTNTIQHLNVKNLETVNMLFTLVSIVLWNTIQWHQHFRFKNLLAIGLASALTILVKPSEIFVCLIPIFWGVYSKNSFIEKWSLIKHHKKGILITIFFAFLLFIPQMLYWFIMTGKPIIDSYKNPGVGLDFFSPHILDVLFSYRKGWFVYTPVMILSLIGLYFFYKNRRQEALGLIIYFVISFYIIASWTEWWYGAAYSCRPVIASYPILFIGLGMFLQSLRKTVIKLIIGVFITAAIGLNIFQWWQQEHYILDSYRNTKEYYWAVFLKTKVPDNAEILKSVNRDFANDRSWPDKWRYEKVMTRQMRAEADDTTSTEFSKILLKIPYEEITKEDHVWLELTGTISGLDSSCINGPYLVITAMWHGKNYGYLAVDPKTAVLSKEGNLTKIKVQCMTPPIRSKTDEIVTYLWNPGKCNVMLKTLEMNAFERVR